MPRPRDKIPGRDSTTIIGPNIEIRTANSYPKATLGVLVLPSGCGERCQRPRLRLNSPRPPRTRPTLTFATTSHHIRLLEGPVHIRGLAGNFHTSRTRAIKSAGASLSSTKMDT